MSRGGLSLSKELHSDTVRVCSANGLTFQKPWLCLPVAYYLATIRPEPHYSYT